MKKKIIILAVFILSIVPTCISAEKEQFEEWTNPIIPQRADPHVFLHTDGYYYLAATMPFFDCVELRRSRAIGGHLAGITMERKWHTGFWCPRA